MQQKDSSKTAGLSRRTMMAMAGGFGLLGTSSLSASASSATQGPERITEQVVGEAGWMYDTIQQAHDDLPEEDMEGADGGGLIYVTESYDSDHEEFPIELTKVVRVIGEHRGSTTVDATGSGETVFRISEEPPRPYNRSRTVENLQIVGGEVGVEIAPETHTLLTDLILDEQNRDGIAIERPGSTHSFLNYYNNVDVFNSGQYGFNLGGSDASHADLLERCTVRYAGEAGALLKGSATAVHGGAYERNDGPGIVYDSRSNAFTVRDVYFENNGDAESFDAELVLTGGEYIAGANRGPTTPVIEGNYFNGLSGESDAAIHLEYTTGATILGNTYWNFSGDRGFLSIADTCEDIDYHRPANTDYVAEDDDNFLLIDEGRRTRSDGVIQPTDLSEIDGGFAGDRGIHNGSGDKRWGLYLWREGHDEWVHAGDSAETI